MYELIYKQGLSGNFFKWSGGNALLSCYEWRDGELSQFKRLCHMSLILNLYLIGISGESERMRYSNNSNYEVIRRQGFIIQWMPTSTSTMKGWFYIRYRIIKVYSSDREDGCPKNSVDI